MEKVPVAGDVDNQPVKLKKHDVIMQCLTRRIATKCRIVLIISLLLVTFGLLQLAEEPHRDEIHAASLQAAIGNVESTTEMDIVKEHLILTGNVFDNAALRNQMLKRKVERLKERFDMPRNIRVNNRTGLLPNYKTHIFYYAWYANPEYDGSYRHWNHSFVPNWKYDDTHVYPTGAHNAPADIGSNYYPALGCYSSNDPNVIKTHMRQLRNAGIGVIVLSWAPPNYPDSPDPIMDKLFAAALTFNIKIALHIEPYAARHPANLRTYLEDFMQRFGTHPALFRMRKYPNSVNEVPVFYVYDSYLIPEYAWRDMLSKKGRQTIRGTPLDGIFLGLLVDLNHRTHIKKSHFDGFYTYFAANSFSYGSTWKNWKNLGRYAKQNDLFFAPSVGPGYMDTNIRPWNSQSIRPRRHGQYYDVAWRTALASGASFISITSFNEWHEGTQIEPAQRKHNGKHVYIDYAPEGPLFYMNLTQFWIEQYEKQLQH